MHDRDRLAGERLRGIAQRIPFNTLRAYRGDLHRFVTTMPGDLDTITAPQIESYLSAGGVGVATSRRRHACLRSFYHWLMLHELCWLKSASARRQAART